MNADKNIPTTKEQHAQEENKSSEHPLNPFDKSSNTSSNRRLMEEEANAEQQRKETLTERD